MLFKCSDGLMFDLIEFLDNVPDPSEISFRCKINPIARRSHQLVWRPLSLTMEVAVFFTLEVTSCLARALTHGIFFRSRLVDSIYARVCQPLFPTATHLIAQPVVRGALLSSLRFRQDLKWRNNGGLFGCLAGSFSSSFLFLRHTHD